MNTKKWTGKPQLASESSTLGAIIDYLERKRIRYVRVHPVRLVSRKGKTFPGRIKASQKGAPDLVIATPHGQTLWVETKCAVGKVRREQALWQQDLYLAGHIHYYIRSIDEFLGVARVFGL